MQRRSRPNTTAAANSTAPTEEEKEIDDMWNHNPLEDEKKREQKTHEEKLAKARWGEKKSLLKVTNFTEYEMDAPKGYTEHISYADPGMTIKEMHAYDTAEAMRKGVNWSKKSRHADPTYPMNKTAKVYNFPESAEAIAAAKAANASGQGSSFLAMFSNQGKLERLMRYDDFLSMKLPGSEATYPIHDSHSWIEPYYPRDHAYTWP